MKKERMDKMIDLLNNVGFIWMGFWIMLVYIMLDITCFKIPRLANYIKERKIINESRACNQDSEPE
jgi:hypothetical protein